MKLIEFANNKNEILRGLYTEGKADFGVIFISGFERSAIAEKKFKIIVDELQKRDVATYRFDCTGCGASNGDFRFTTVASLLNDFTRAIEHFKGISRLQKVVVVGHSVAGCVIGEYWQANELKKAVLLAPALNQKDLLRYYFVRKIMKGEKAVNWNNYREMLNEKMFEASCQLDFVMTKTNYLNGEYFRENKDKDYSGLFEKFNDQVLLIASPDDDKMPADSLNIDFKNKVIIKHSDHDYERPDVVDQWLEKAINFIVG